MKRTLVHRLAAVAALTVAAVVSGPAQTGGTADAGRLVYADFQNLQNGRPVSARGGRTQLNRYAQNMANAPKFRGLENSEPPAPAPARGKADDPNIAAAFEYEVRIPNEWAGVHMEVFGNPEKDGKLVADDVSGYKFITMQIFAKGPKSIKLELISRGHGLDMESGYPAATFRLSPGFNTYKMKLDSFRQPGWAQPINVKRDILQKLTSVTIGVHCDKCEMESGTVLVDNIAFEN